MDELLVGVEKELAEGDAGHDDQATHKVVIHKHFPLAFKAKSEFEEKLMRLTERCTLHSLEMCKLEIHVFFFLRKRVLEYFVTLGSLFVHRIVETLGELKQNTFCSLQRGVGRRRRRSTTRPLYKQFSILLYGFGFRLI